MSCDLQPVDLLQQLCRQIFSASYGYNTKQTKNLSFASNFMYDYNM